MRGGANSVNLAPMRLLLILAVLLCTGPALAQGWGSYANARYGATADVPPGFLPLGPEAADSDGQLFRSRHGAVLGISGAKVPGGDFMGFVSSRIAVEHSSSGWTITGQAVTPDWAEYSGNRGALQVRVRMIAACGGRHALYVRLEFNGDMSAEQNRVFRSLRAGPARAC